MDRSLADSQPGTGEPVHSGPHAAALGWRPLRGWLAVVLAFLTGLAFGIIYCSVRARRAYVRQRHWPPLEEWRVVALCGSTDYKAKYFMKRALEPMGIPSVMTGTLLHDVRVPPSKAEEALRILKNDATLKGDWFRLFRQDERGNRVEVYRSVNTRWLTPGPTPTTSVAPSAPPTPTPPGPTTPTTPAAP